MRIVLALFALFAFAAPLTAAAEQDNPTYTGPESASEKAFVSAIQADLMKRYPTAADAEKAGYFRYTNADETGAISYANLQWVSTDIKHPSQLWYDKNGNLLGADYSIAYSPGATAPVLWGVNPGRWRQFDGHIHYVVKDPKGGALLYADDQYAMDNKFVAAGGSLDDPSAQTLVVMKKVPDAGEVVKIFHFPSLWDLIVWVKPNPSGAFAWKNPSVTP